MKEYIKPTIEKEEVLITDVITASTAEASITLVDTTGKAIHNFTGDDLFGR